MCGAEAGGRAGLTVSSAEEAVSTGGGGAPPPPGGGQRSFVLHHVGLSCDDPLLIERWYSTHFGFTRGRVYAPGPDQVVMIQANGVYLELFKSSQPRPDPKAGEAGPEYSGFRHFAFLVDDLDATLARLGAEARITLGPLDMAQFIPGMRVAWVADPEGNVVELNQGYVDEASPPPL